MFNLLVNVGESLGIFFATYQYYFLGFVVSMAAFMSVLHMYESFGWWRRADYLKVHFAESWNEMHHLLIMEVRSLSFFF